MYTNKHATRLAQQTLQAGQIIKDINRWKSDLEWFSTFDIEEANSKLGHAKRAVQVVSNRLAEHKNKIESSQQRLTELKEIAGAFSPVFGGRLNKPLLIGNVLSLTPFLNRSANLRPMTRSCCVPTKRMYAS